jgi:hypothetical protein
MNQAVAGLLGATIGVTGTALTASVTAWTARLNQRGQRQQARRHEQREMFAALLAAAYGMQSTNPKRRSTYHHRRVPSPPGHRELWVQPINESHLDAEWIDAVHHEASRIAQQLPLIALVARHLYSEAREINGLAQQLADLAKQVQQGVTTDHGHSAHNIYARLNTAVDHFTREASMYLESL